MDGLVPFGALPVEIAGRNRLTRRIILEAIRHDQDWKNGDYEQQPPLAARLAPLITMMIGNPITQYERYPTRAAADAWYDQIVQRASATDTNDKLYYYEASSDYNSAPDLEKVKAKLLLVLFADDQVNSPAFGALEREMPRVANGQYVIIPAGKQSNGELNNFNVELWRSYLEDFLRSLRH